MARQHSSAFCVGLGLLAGSLLACELLLLRLFKIAQGSEFTTIAISIALLGFGASGTLLAVARRRAKRHARAIAVASAPLAGLAMLAAYLIGQTVPFRPEFLVWGGPHVWHLLLWTLPLVVPFLIGATGLGVVFIRWPRRTRSLYAANLIGSGLGAIGLYLALFWIRPEDGILAIAGIASWAGALMAWRWRGALSFALGLFGVAALAAMAHFPLPEIRISDTRDLWQLRQLPGAHTAVTTHSPDGRVDVIASGALHLASGQSLVSPANPFEQMAILIDGDIAGDLVLGTHSGDRSPSGDDLLTAVPWRAAAQMRSLRNSVFLGLASETEALRMRVRRRGQSHSYLRFASHPVREIENLWTRVSLSAPRYSRMGAPPWIHAESLGALRTISQRQETTTAWGERNVVISVARVGHATEADTLHTTAGIRQALDSISPGGAVIFAVSVDTPPRAALRLVALAAEIAREQFGDSADRHLVALRGFSQVAAILSPAEFTSEEIQRLRDFTRRWNFDLIWAPGISPEEVNQHSVLDEPIFHETARRILAGEAEAVRAEYPFELRPPTEWWPFFWQPFRPATLGGMLIGLRPAGLETIPEANAVLALVWQIRALAAAAVALILLPLWWLPRAGAEVSRARTSLYFAALGLGYLMLEILMIFLARRLLGTPVLAAAVVVAGFLVFSGIGSLASARHRWVFTSLIVTALIAVGLMEVLTRHAMGVPLAVRILAVLTALHPLAHRMGMPFPRGLRDLGARAPALVPWAWGINGFASVLAAPLATLIAMTSGYQIVLAAGLLCYILAGLSQPPRRGR